jgi:hypothetical protein
MALMGYREYSRHAGVTLRAVQKAIDAGYILITPDKKIDSDQADRDWRNSTEVMRPAVSMSAPVSSPLRPAPGSSRPRANISAPPGPEVGGDDDGADPVEPESDATTSEYRSHRASREKFSALKQELEYKQLVGELISVDEAKRIAFTTFRGIRDSVLNVPARLKDQLSAIDDPYEIERLLEASLADALAGVDLGRMLQDQDE